MRDKSKDLRYQRTQRHLKQAIIDLLKVKDIDKISVRELSELADINRGTFYLHYDCPKDLLRAIEGDLFKNIMGSYKQQIRENPKDFFYVVYNGFLDNKEMALVLSGQHLGHDFWAMLGDRLQDVYIKDLLNKEVSRQKDQIFLEYYMNFVKAGFLSMIREWVYKGMKESVEKMVDMSLRLLSLNHIDRL